jgi:Flp pilus assembly protein CpaB
MTTKALLLAIVVVLLILAIGWMWMKYWKKAVYPLGALQWNYGTNGNMMVLVTPTALGRQLVGKRIHVAIATTNAPVPVATFITTAFADYSGTIAALDSTGTQVSVSPVPSMFTKSFSVNAAVTGTLTVYGE